MSDRGQTELEVEEEEELDQVIVEEPESARQRWTREDIEIQARVSQTQYKINAWDKEGKKLQTLRLAWRTLKYQASRRQDFNVFMCASGLLFSTAFAGAYMSWNSPESSFGKFARIMYNCATLYAAIFAVRYLMSKSRWDRTIDIANKEIGALLFIMQDYNVDEHEEMAKRTTEALQIWRDKAWKGIIIPCGLRNQFTAIYAHELDLSSEHSIDSHIVRKIIPAKTPKNNKRYSRFSIYRWLDSLCGLFA